MEEFGQVPDELKQLEQWVLWKSETRDKKPTKTRHKKPTKVPYNAQTLHRASSTNSRTWSDFSTVWDLITQHPKTYAGIGFMFSPDDPYVGIDFDDCLEDGELKPWAREMVDLMQPTYTEVSPSGNGIKMWIKADKIRKEKRVSIGKHRGGGGIEIYDKGRYFTVTGKLFGEATTVAENQAGLDQLMQKVWDDPKPKTKPQRKPTTMDQDDSELLDIALKDAKFNGLWNGNWEGKYTSQSEADLGFCNKLAYYWNKDFNAIDRMFQQSGLYREKWDREDIKNNTIDKAIAGTTTTYQEQQEQNEFSIPGQPSETKTKTVSILKQTELAKTDAYLCEQLKQQHGHDLMWCDIWGCWLIWDGKRWKTDNHREIYDYARQLVDYYLKKALDTYDAKKLQLWMDVAKSSSANSKQKNVVDMLKSQVPTHPDELDTQPMLLNCGNGTINLETGKLQKHRQQDQITKITNTNYDPDAKCSRWMQFLDEIFNSNQNLIKFMQRAVGYALTSEIREHILLVLHGTGRNGKSTLLETLIDILGDYAKPSAPDLLMQKRNDTHPTEIAELKGMRFVACVETEEGHRLKEGLVKRLTGGDTQKGRFIHQDWFEFRQTHKLFLAVNRKPDIRGTDEGIWSRIRLIPFDVKIDDDKQDPKLMQKLIKEAPGILAWAVKGCLDWQKEGLGNPQEVKQASTNWREDADVVGRFIKDRCIIQESATVQGGLLYSSYQDWCDSQGERPNSNKIFAEKLQEKGYEKGRTNKGSTWKGIGLLDTKSTDGGSTNQNGDSTNQNGDSTNQNGDKSSDSNGSIDILETRVTPGDTTKVCLNSLNENIRVTPGDTTKVCLNS
jgi:putative DNA primase/helicase